MSEKQKNGIATVFDDVAPRYDSNRFFAISAQHLVEQIKPNNAKTMLDVATGTGAISLRAAEKFPDMKIVAIDLSIGMLKIAKKKAHEKGLKNCNFILKDAENIKCEQPEFDVITCGYALFFLLDQKTAFKNLYKCLKIGGHFIFSSFTEKAFSPSRDMFIELLQDFGVEIPELSGNRLQSPGEIEQLCQTANVTDVHIISKQIRYNVEFEEWWSLLNRSGYKGVLKQIGQIKIQEFKERHFRQLTKHLHNEKLLLIADSLYSVVVK